MGLDLKGFNQFGEMMKRAPGRLVDEMDKAINRTAHNVRSRTVKGIGGEYQSSFAPLSERYARWKARRRGSNLILVSGVRGGKKQQIGGNYRNSFAVEKVESGVYAVGSNYPQARALEKGYAKRNLPARRHLGRAVDESIPDLKREVLEASKRTFGF